MKKFFAMMMALAMILTMTACGNSAPAAEAPKFDPNAKSEGVMTYAEYDAAELNSAVVIEGFVQAKQSWWDNKATLYLQDGEGAYFVYTLSCSEEDYNKMTVGTKLQISGYKIEWSGEVEVDGSDATFQIIEGESYVADAMDVTALLDSADLIKNQNKKVAFKGMTVEPSKNPAGEEVAFLYNWDGSGAEGSDSDLYFNVSHNGKTYNFVVEYYLCDANGVCGADTEVYKAVQNLKIGDQVDLEGFLYWYEGVNPHITSVTPAK